MLNWTYGRWWLPAGTQWRREERGRRTCSSVLWTPDYSRRTPSRPSFTTNTRQSDLGCRSLAFWIELATASQTRCFNGDCDESEGDASWCTRARRPPQSAGRSVWFYGHVRSSSQLIRFSAIDDHSVYNNYCRPAQCDFRRERVSDVNPLTLTVAVRSQL